MVWDAVLCPGMLSYGLDAVLYPGTLSYVLSQSNLPKKRLKKKLFHGLGRCPMSWDAVLWPGTLSYILGRCPISWDPVLWPVPIKSTQKET